MREFYMPTDMQYKDNLRKEKFLIALSQVTGATEDNIR